MRRIAVVTGGTSGLGRWIVLEFAQRGYSVAFTYRSNHLEASQLEKELRLQNCSAYYEQVDITSEEEVFKFVRHVVGKYGRIDVLINNAGIFENSLLPDTTVERWNRVLQVNMTGSFLCMKHVWAVMKTQMDGVILTVSSVMGETGIYGACSYAATKAGLIGLSKSVALEGAKYGIRSNVISVGVMDEGMSLGLSEKVKESLVKKIPLKKAGRAKDLAKLVICLCDEELSYITGQVIRFNGGMYM